MAFAHQSISVCLALALAGSNSFAVDVKPDLVVLVFGSAADARLITAPGQAFSFRIGLDNMNAADAHHVRLTAILPNGLKFQTSEPAPTTVESGNHLVWEIDSPDPKTLPRFFEVTVETEANVIPGSHLDVSAEAECSEGNADPAHNRASQTIYVQPLGAHLVVSRSTVDSMLLTAENPATFKVNVDNIGNLASTRNRLEATLPKGVKLDKADPKPAFSNGQAVTFNLGDLARAESKAVSITVALDPRQLSDLLGRDHSLTFAFRVSRIVSGAEITDSRFTVAKHIESAGQDVAIWLMPEEHTALAGASSKNDVACVIRFANLGNQTAHKIAVALYLGSGVTVARLEPQTSGITKNDAYPGGVAHWDVGDLDAGMSRSMRSVVHMTSRPGNGAVVTAIITADGLDIDSTNNTASLLLRSPSPPGVSQN